VPQVFINLLLEVQHVFLVHLVLTLEEAEHLFVPSVLLVTMQLEMELSHVHNAIKVIHNHHKDKVLVLLVQLVNLKLQQVNLHVLHVNLATLRIQMRHIHVPPVLSEVVNHRMDNQHAQIVPLVILLELLD